MELIRMTVGTVTHERVGINSCAGPTASLYPTGHDSLLLIPPLSSPLHSEEQKSKKLYKDTMADSAELAFVKNHVNVIGSLSVQFPDDYQQPPHDSLKKLPIIPVSESRCYYFK